MPSPGSVMATRFSPTELTEYKPSLFPECVLKHLLINRFLAFVLSCNELIEICDDGSELHVSLRLFSLNE